MMDIDVIFIWYCSLLGLVEYAVGFIALFFSCIGLCLLTSMFSKKYFHRSTAVKTQSRQNRGQPI